MALPISLWNLLGDTFYQVLEYLSRRDLAALSLMNKASHVDVEPYLFAKVEWRWERHQSPPVISFLNTILKRPKLATHVKSIVLEGEYLGEYRRDVYFPSYKCETRMAIDRLNLPAAIEAIKGTGVPYVDRWEQDLCERKMDALISLMLSQLPNLRTLTLGPCLSSPPGLIGMLFMSALCKGDNYRLPTYNSIRDLTCLVKRCDKDHSAEKDAWDWETDATDALPFFYLPELRSLSLDLDNSRTLQWPAHKPSLASLTALRLSCVREPYLEDILSTTTGLKKFRWDFLFSQRHGDFRLQRPTIELDTLGKALSQVGDTLEELILTAELDLGDAVNFPSLEIRGVFTDVNKFPKLKILRAPMPFLLQWGLEAGLHLAEIVPKHVQMMTITDELEEHIHFNWVKQQMFAAVELWLRSLRLTHAELKSLTLIIDEPDYDWTSKDVEVFKDCCIREGVEGTFMEMAQTWYDHWTQRAIIDGADGVYVPRCKGVECPGMHQWRGHAIRCSDLAEYKNAGLFHPAVIWGS